jgi:hypothetical protein
MQSSHARRRTTILAAAVLSVVSLSSFAARADAQATRTWISGDGNDANPCSRTAPCKTLAGALPKTVARGEINALDPGGFGGATITKSITIDLSTAGIGGVLNANTNGIVVNAAAGDDVVLRGLGISGGAFGGAAGACAPYGGLNGVSIRGARTVRIEDSTIGSQATAVRVAPDAADVSVLVNRVDIANNCAGINAEPAAGRVADVAIQASTISNSGTAVRAADGARVRVTGSTLFANALGIQTVGTGTIDSWSDNRVFGNVDDGVPTSTPGTPGTPGAPGAPGALVAGPQGPAGPAGPQGEPAFKLLLALPSASLKARAGRAVKLSYLSTADATSTLEVRKGRRVIATIKRAARSGRNTIAWNGKSGRRAARRGKYTLRLTAASPDGQSATSTARLTLR